MSTCSISKMEVLFIELEEKEVMCCLALGQISHTTNETSLHSILAIHFILLKGKCPNLQCHTGQLLEIAIVNPIGLKVDEKDEEVRS